MKTEYAFFPHVVIAVVLAKNFNKIPIHQENDSWMSVTDYRTVLRVSFPYARCCNVYVNGSSYKVDQSFRYFTMSYPYDYLIMERIYQCQGYLLIGSEVDVLLWALNRVPSTISTTELLIIYIDNLAENSQLFNGTLYRNANANLISFSGMWSLSENFLEPRVFEKVQSYEDLRYTNGLANFKGRELRVASYYNPPLFYMNRTVKKVIKGIEREIFTTDNDDEKDGVELQIFMLIAERLNFTWTIRPPSGKFRYGRRMGNNSWEGGMIGQLIKKEIDLAFSGVWLKEDHNIFTNLSFPWGQLAIRFLVPRPRPYTSFWALTRPFTPTVWICVFVIILWYTCYMTIRSRLNPIETTKRFRYFSNTWMELTGRLIGIWVPKKITGAKVQLQFWQTAGLLIVTAYCSSLAASLAGAEYEARIDTVKQFVEAGLVWGRQGPLPIFSDYFDLDDEYSSLLPQSFKEEKSLDDRHQNILKGNYAIIGRVVGGVFFPENEVINDDLRNYRVMSNSVGSYYACFAMQPWLLEKVDKMMHWTIESGFTSFYLEDVIRRRTGSSLREVLIEHDKNNGTARVLAFTPLASGFALLIVGLIIASVVFSLELKSKNRKKINKTKEHSRAVKNINKQLRSCDVNNKMKIKVSSRNIKENNRKEIIMLRE